MDRINQRLQEYLRAKNLTARDFERITGLGNGTCKKIGESTRSTTFNRISSSDIDLNVDWLLTGEGPMISTKTSNARLLGGVYASSPKDNEDVVMIDYVPGTATATFIEYNGGTNPQFEKIAVLKQYGEILDNSYKVFEVVGESMSPRIPNRAKILTKEIPESKWFMAEGVVVVVFGDEVVVKRIIDNDLATRNAIVLSSDNPNYGARTVALADIRHMYKAIRIISADIV
ncbi:MAG: hypothetical protein HDS31_01905 [Bacteroides sp.]|nr:hypothetical protein [Bacteroides sp.]